MLCLELIFIICILQFDSWYRNSFVCDILYVLCFSTAREISVSFSSSFASSLYSCPGFSLGRLHMGGGGGGQVQEDKALMGGPNFDRLYHKLKVLLLLSCNYTMEFIGYDSIKTH